MTEAKVVGQIDEWKLTRWDYDGAPLVAERGQLSVSFDRDGDLDIDCIDDFQSRLFIPSAVLERLLADRDARGTKGGGGG